jgi:3-deoxy-D-manno-octulosonate 8-phosphate phosphatase (KDO 8-P phosphatase)
MQCLPGSKEFAARAAAISLLVLDVDGTLTDGSIYVDDAGAEFKRFDVRDGLGIKAWQKAGLTVAIITARDVPCVTHRARQLGIDLVMQGAHRKQEALDSLLKVTGLTDANIACMGDDWMDVPLFQRAALAFAVPDADAFTQSHAHVVTTAPGGHGAVREAVEALLQAKNLLDRVRLSFAGQGT